MNKDRVNELRFHQMSMTLRDECWGDTEILMKDYRGREIARQLIRSVGSVSANIEEGYGKEYPRFLKISRGSATESKGWYTKSKFLLKEEIITDRIRKLDTIIAMITKTIGTLEEKNRL